MDQMSFEELGAKILTWLSQAEGFMIGLSNQSYCLLKSESYQYQKSTHFKDSDNPSAEIIFTEILQPASERVVQSRSTFFKTNKLADSQTICELMDIYKHHYWIAERHHELKEKSRTLKDIIESYSKLDAVLRILATTGLNKFDTLMETLKSLGDTLFQYFNLFNDGYNGLPKLNNTPAVNKFIH